jgi:tetratricopeptide (TPR) repeat protein
MKAIFSTASPSGKTCHIALALSLLAFSTGARAWAQAPAALTPAAPVVAEKARALSLGPLADEQWDKLQKGGNRALDAGQYGEAERFYSAAVKRARSFDAGDERLAKSAGALGRLLTLRGRFSEAEPYLEEELAVKQIISFDDDNGKLIPDMASLIRFYLNGGTIGRANPLAEKVLAFVEGKLSEASNQSKGKLVLKAGMPLQGWAGEAAPVMRDPLIEWAIACDDIGTLYSQHATADDQFNMAERLFKAALDIKSTVLGKQHLSLANSYDSLGSLALQRKDYVDAESYFQDALEITERIQPAEHPQVYARLDKLAKCLIQENKLPEAEQLYLRAQGLWKNGPSKNGNEARALFSLASLYTQQKRFEEAAPLLEQALAEAEKYYGPDSIALVPYLEKEAYVLYYLGRKPEMDGLKERARIIAAAEPKPDSQM